MTDKQNANPTTGNESSAPNDNAAARVTDQEAVRKIIEQYIDKADLEISEDTGFVRHPAWWDNDWKSEANLPKETAALLKIKENPAEWQKLNNTAKDAIKEHVRKRPLANIFCCLDTLCAFKILKDAKAYISTDEFSQLLRAAWGADNFRGSESEDFTNDEILKLLESCNMQKFMTSEEWKVFETVEALKGTDDLTTVYRGRSVESEFLWAESAAAAFLSDGDFNNGGDESGYMAEIKSDDILAAVIVEDFAGNLVGYIVNPDKLYNVKFVNDLRDYCERDDLSEEDWEGYEGDDDD